MTCPVSWTAENLANLELAMADGTLEVQYDDRRVKYRSLDEMERLRNLMRQSLCGDGIAGNTSGRFGKVFAKSNKGL